MKTKKGKKSNWKILAVALALPLITSCTEVALFTAGAVGGGALGYYLGKEGFSVKIEKQKEKDGNEKR